MEKLKNRIGLLAIATAFLITIAVLALNLFWNSECYSKHEINLHKSLDESSRVINLIKMYVIGAFLKFVQFSISKLTA